MEETSDTDNNASLAAQSMLRENTAETEITKDKIDDHDLQYMILKISETSPETTGSFCAATYCCATAIAACVMIMHGEPTFPLPEANAVFGAMLPFCALQLAVIAPSCLNSAKNQDCTELACDTVTCKCCFFSICSNEKDPDLDTDKIAMNELTQKIKTELSEQKSKLSERNRSGNPLEPDSYNWSQSIRILKILIKLKNLLCSGLNSRQTQETTQQIKKLQKSITSIKQGKVIMSCCIFSPERNPLHDTEIKKLSKEFCITAYKIFDALNTDDTSQPLLNLAATEDDASQPLLDPTVTQENLFWELYEGLCNTAGILDPCERSWVKTEDAMNPYRDDEMEGRYNMSAVQNNS
jgi:hypothetical protein